MNRRRSIQISSGVLAALVMLGARAEGIERPMAHPPARPTAVAERAMFDFLTRNDWADSGCSSSEADSAANDSAGPPFEFPGGTCGMMSFLRSGICRRWAFSDYPERESSSLWNFRLTSDTTGLVMLGNASMIPFARRDRSLWFSGVEYSPSDRGADVRDEAARTRGDLPLLAEPPALARLCREPWVKEDDFALYSEPTRIRFDPDLTYEAEYRHGSCRRAGRFWVDGPSLFFDSPDSSCDQRQVDDFLESMSFWIDSTSMVLRGEIYYAREHEPPRLGRRTFGGSRGDLVLTISYAKPLRPGHSTMLHVSFHYLGRYPLNRPIELRAFRLISMPAVSHRNGYQPFGHPDTLAVRTYTGWRLGDRETRADSLRIRPSIRAKFVEFRFEWDSIDSDGECHSSAWLQLQDQE